MKQERVQSSWGATPALLSSVLLGAVLLAWLVLALFAPGLGSVIAVFGSPIFAFFVILRLLTLGPSEAVTGAPGRTASELAGDPDLLRRVAARDGERCAICSAPDPRHLRATLPVGKNMSDLERRFTAVCEACATRRGRS